jgi:hypothetical protein
MNQLSFRGYMEQFTGNLCHKICHLRPVFLPWYSHVVKGVSKWGDPIPGVYPLLSPWLLMWSSCELKRVVQNFC